MDIAGFFMEGQFKYLIKFVQIFNDVKKNITYTLALLTITIAAQAQNKVVDKPKLVTNMDSVSYALGLLIGVDLKSSGFESINFKTMSDAMQKSMKGDSLPMDKMAATNILQNFGNAEMKKKSAVNEAAAKVFLSNNKKNQGVTETASGLQYKVLTMGMGSKPAMGQKVKVHYTGKLLDGKIFDSSVQRGEPAVFGVDQVIPGWTESLLLMTVGSKWELYIPSNLAYGPSGTQGIPGGSLLIFEVELLGIE